VFALVVSIAVDRLTRGYRIALRDAHRARLAAATRALELEAEQRESLQRQLDTAERLATAGAVAAAVCHEVRNPLTAVMCNLELASIYTGDDSPPEGAMAEVIAQATEGAEQVRVVISDLATLATPADRIEAVRLADIAASASRLSAHELRKAELELDIDDELEAIGSRARLVQVLVNLICNAAQASASDRPNHIRVTGRRRGGHAEVEIRDTGVGMDRATLERVFEPFFTTRDDDGGSGLGVAIARSIVESTGGEMSIDSEPGVGTVVRLRMVASRATRSSEPPSAPASDEGVSSYH
jgi:signal transduction histidine kinase